MTEQKIFFTLLAIFIDFVADIPLKATRIDSKTR